MNGWNVLPRVVLLLGVAAAAGLVMRRFRQSVLVGYLAAGLLLGPTGFGLVRAEEEVALLSELGIALLLFSIGLEFSAERLREFGRVALGGGVVQLVGTMVAITCLAAFFASGFSEAVVLGLAFAMSSTAVVLRTLTDRAELDSTHGRNAIGILLVQDLAVIPVLIGVEALASGTGGASVGIRFLIRVGLVLLFMVGSWLVARMVLPGVLSAAVLSGNRELPVVIAVCTSVGAAWAAHTLGFTPSLGAFIAGIVLAESPFAAQIRADVTPLSAVFITLFFASVGSLVTLPLQLGFALQLAAGVTVTMLVKALIAAAAVFLFQRSARAAIATGIVLSQVGEFTFVVAATAHQNGLLRPEVFQLTLGISITTLLLTPWAAALAPVIAARLVRRLPVRMRSAVETGKAHPAWRRIIVIGYGPAGQDVVQYLSERQVSFLVLEMNPNTVRANSPQIPIELGDATQREILQHAGLGQSLALIITIPDPATSAMICHAARRLDPGVPIIVRARYHQFAASLEEAGANRVVDEEHVVGGHLASEALALCDRQTSAT